MKKIQTTSSGIKLGQWLNRGEVVRVRETSTGKLVSLDYIRDYDYGLNGRRPVTINWQNNTIWHRAEWKTNLETRLLVDVLKKMNADCKFMFRNGRKVTIIYDVETELYESDIWVLNKHNRFVFELYQ